MRQGERDAETLRRLASMPFLDRLELAAVSDVSEGTAHGSLSRLRREGSVDTIRHATPLIASTRRYAMTRVGLNRLMRCDGMTVWELLRRYSVSSHWRRLLLQRLDAVGVVYRLASAVADAGGPLRFRWYRAMPLDAAVVLPSGRTIGIVRRGPTSDRTTFSERVWRLLDGYADPQGRPMPRALLVVVPDEVRLREADRLLARAPGPVYLALEEDVARSGADDPLWRAPSSGKALDLGTALSYVRHGGGLPFETPASRGALPDRLSPPESGPEVEGHLLSALLKSADKRMIDCLSEWPLITPGDLSGLLELSDSRVSHLAARLARLGLVSQVTIEARRRLALSDRGLALLARRDRTAVATALRRWSAEPLVTEAPFTWRNVTGSRSRHLARHIEHTEAVHRFMGALVQQAGTTQCCRIVRTDPPHKSTRYFRHGEALRSIHPDGFGIVQCGGRIQPFFLEWERRALHPSTMAARIAPYLRYFSSQQPVDDHGDPPIVLVVFDDPLAEARFLGVARRETERSRVDLPLWVSHREMLDREGPLGRAWRGPEVLEATYAFGKVEA